MWYIRFLKVPECRTSFSRSKHGLTEVTIIFTIAITTDLGDEFLAGDDFSNYTASLIKANTQDLSTTGKAVSLAESHFTWSSGKRSVTHKFNATLEGDICISSLRLVVSQRDAAQDPQCMLSGQLPIVVSILSDFFETESGKSTSGRVQRSFPVGKRRFLNVWEETGESIARHIWDAGIATWLYVLESSAPSPKRHELSKILKNMPKDVNILELGSGCGIGGLAFALTGLSDRPGRNCNVLLTDLPEAMPILEYNISQNQHVKGCTVKSQVLDWDDDQALVSLLETSRFDIVLVSDCTYNCDSCPALVRTLSAIAKTSNPYVIVSMKVRHDSEIIFFTLMEEAGFGTMCEGRYPDGSHDRILLPHSDGNRSPTEGYQKIDIYIFRMKEIGKLSHSSLNGKEERGSEWKRF